MEKIKSKGGEDLGMNRHRQCRMITSTIRPVIPVIDWYVLMAFFYTVCDFKRCLILSSYVQMLEKIPKTESLKCTLQRSSVYWDKVIAPALREGKTVLVVGHENNLRSLLMQLEGISEHDIINLCLPRAVPLAYRLDENLRPLDRTDGKLDEATGFLRGEWLGGDAAVAQILERDRKQVYDTTIAANLEAVEENNKWRAWMEFAVGKPSPEMRVCSNPGHFVEDNDSHHEEPQQRVG